MSETEHAQLFTAIEANNSELIATLLESVDVNTRAFVFETLSPLILAVTRGQADAVRVLLGAGARVDEYDTWGNCSMGVAVERERADLVLLLVGDRDRDADNWVDALERAIEMGSETVAFDLVNAGAPLDDVDPDLLCEAAAMSMRVAQSMLDRGFALREIRDSECRTPCHAAAWRARDLLFLRWLVDVAGVDPNAIDRRGRICAHELAIFGRHEALCWLLQATANVDARDDEERTPLHWACVARETRCAQLLIAAGADVHTRDAEGSTPAHLAGRVGAEAADILCALLAAGADFSVTNLEGVTAHQIATASGFALPCSAPAVAAARRHIGALQLAFVRSRAFEVCVALQALDIDALQMCEVLLHACGPLAPMVPFHLWWRVATTIKHHPRSIQKLKIVPD